MTKTIYVIFDGCIVYTCARAHTVITVRREFARRVPRPVGGRSRRLAGSRRRRLPAPLAGAGLTGEVSLGLAVGASLQKAGRAALFLFAFS